MNRTKLQLAAGIVIAASLLPDGATSETVKGTAYFVYAGAYYRPFYSGSDVVYMVVEKPKA